LEYKGIITDKRGEGNVWAASNDAKFLTSSSSSAHIPYYVGILDNFIIGKTKERRGEGR
jgi:hypothetical protein